MKDILYLYVLVNLIAYGGGAGVTYHELDEGTFDCEAKAESYAWYWAIGLAGYMLETSEGLNSAIQDYCETHDVTSKL